jgi:acetyl-CoA carboxylase carboxyltransferase component
MAGKVAELRARQERAHEMGGPERLRRHRESGRLPVRERIALLIDEDSWFEIGALGLPERRTDRHVPGDAVVTGFARLDGRRIGVVGIDSSVLAGTTAPTSMRKQGRLIEMAQRFGLPLVLLCDADGGRIPDVMGWRFSHLPLDFRTFVKSPEGQPPVPRAAAILGPSYGDSALHASTAHFVVMIQTGSVALSGPSVVSAAIAQEVTVRSLAAPKLRARSATHLWWSITNAKRWTRLLRSCRICLRMLPWQRRLRQLVRRRAIRRSLPRSCRPDRSRAMT